jgi:hypothetical protein
MKTVLAFVAFNNNYLVNVLLRSFVSTNTGNIEVVIFNNGTEDVDILPSTAKYLGNIKILDNRYSDYIDFEKFLKDNRPKYSDYWHNNYGSMRHCMALDYLIKNIEYDKMILCDVDVIFKRSINDLLDGNLVVGQIGVNPLMRGNRENRLLPFLFLVDSKIKNEISFFDKNRMVLLSSDRYDTGSSFLEDILNKNIPFREIKIDEYISHLGSATWLDHAKRNIKSWVARNAKFLAIPENISVGL